MDDYPTRADEVREAWKQKEKPVSRDEALRALEKKWRAEAAQRRTQAVDQQDVSPEDAGWNNGIAGGMDECADELAAILATASEQAPVFAWVREQPREWDILTESDMSKPCDPAEMLAKGWFPVYRSSPAHTSEARDAEMTDAQCIAVYDAVMRSGITRDVKTPEKKQAIVRAAMRQEAE